MNVLVTYYTQTGNTRKVAEAIFAGLVHSRKKILPIDQVENVGGHDLIFCGFPVMDHGVPGKMVAFLQAMPRGKRLAFFATHGSLRGGEKAITAFYAALGLAHGQKILGTFGCRGEVNPQLIETLADKPQHQAWAIEARGAIGHPNQADLEDARVFAETMLYSAEKIYIS
jgi:flavodoxin I